MSLEGFDLHVHVRFRGELRITEVEQAVRDNNRRGVIPMSPYSTAAAEILIKHLGLTPRAAAEIQDLYSRPASAPEALTASLPR